MSIRFLEAPESLRELVSRIYVHESRESSILDPRWLIVPDGEIKLILPFQGRIRCTIGDSARVHQESRIIVSGMRTTPGYLDFSEGLGAIGVVLKPESAHRLLRAPMHELHDRTLDGEELFGAEARRWHDRLANAASLEDRIERLQVLLRDSLERRDRHDPLLEQPARTSRGWMR